MAFIKREPIIEKKGVVHKQKSKIRLYVLGIFILFVLAGCLDYPALWNKGANWLNSQIGLGVPQFYNKPFKLGLDLQGGTHLVYEANLSGIAEADRDSSMQGIRDLIERRVNLFGVAEPLVQIDKVGDSNRLIVELPGVTDVGEAIKMIGGTPYLEFKTERTQEETDAILKKQQAGDAAALKLDAYFQDTDLTGRFLKDAQLVFDKTTYQPYISLEFNDEGGKIFDELTKNNIGKKIAIYLDGTPISTPRVNEEIPNGKAQITGDFTQAEAKQLAERLNTGALPVPINLISQQNVGPSLGKIYLDKSLQAGFWGLIAVAIFMIIYYRKNGVLAVMALLVYIALNLAIFKLIPVTMSLAGIAGFILSIGMAVDANILIFERMKEEKALGREIAGVLDEGFKRAWLSIRDGHVTTLTTAVILYFFSTSTVRGFALTLFIGVSLSLFTAVVVTRILLKYVYRTS